MAHKGNFWMYDKEAVAAVEAAGLTVAEGGVLVTLGGAISTTHTHSSAPPLSLDQRGVGPLFRARQAGGNRFIVDNAGNISTVGTVDGVDISVHAANESAHHTKYTDAEAVAAVGLRCKVVEIGDWDMNTSEMKSVTHGLTQENIRSVDVVVRNDAGASYYPINYASDYTHVNGTFFISPTDVWLYRLTGGFFDAGVFESTPYNRGWVTIWYAP